MTTASGKNESLNEMIRYCYENPVQTRPSQTGNGLSILAMQIQDRVGEASLPRLSTVKTGLWEGHPCPDYREKDFPPTVSLPRLS